MTTQLKKILAQRS